MFGSFEPKLCFEYEEVRMHLLRSSFVSRVFVLSFLALLASRPAAAQITSLGTSPPTPAGVLSVTAYDDKHNVYLQVWEWNRDTWGRFLNSAGAPLGGNFIVATNKLSFTGKPKVAYSRDNAGVDEFFIMYNTDVNLN